MTGEVSVDVSDRGDCHTGAVDGHVQFLNVSIFAEYLAQVIFVDVLGELLDHNLRHVRIQLPLDRSAGSSRVSCSLPLSSSAESCSRD